jgi:uncharacterized membrane protein YphA (DoxX/SURF4 family)
MNTRYPSEPRKRQPVPPESSILSPRLHGSLASLDRMATYLVSQHSLRLLSVSMGLVFVWFGALKLAGMSPAEPLIRDTLDFLPGTLVDRLILLLAIWEVAIGIGFLSGRARRVVLIMLLLQMSGAMSPLILAPERLWETFPLVWTLEGQYNFKDIILISAGLVIGAAHRRENLAASHPAHDSPSYTRH